jgi:glutamate racemase
VSTNHSISYDNRPIGLFDSGIGGLTVLKSLLGSLKHESFVYLGDTARLPYGSKSPATIERYLRQNIQFLLTQNVKAVIVACNSASTVLLDSQTNFPIPVYNVIEPGAATAIAASSNQSIGVLGTTATINAMAYVKSIHKLAPMATVYQQACPLLVPLVEEGWEDDPLTNLVIYRYLTPILNTGIDTLILGCTHYPALREAITKIAGPEIKLIDSAEAIVQVLRRDFESGLLLPGAQASPLQLMTTDVSPAFSKVAARLMFPHLIPALLAVDISVAAIST